MTHRVEESLRPIIEAFVGSYRTAFEAADGDAITHHLAEIVHVASETGAGVHLETMSHADRRSLVDQLISQYRALGVERVEVRELETIGISSRLGLARVKWALFDRRGGALYEFCAAYTLACEGSWCRIVAIAHDEVAQLHRYLAGRSSSKPPL